MQAFLDIMTIFTQPQLLLLVGLGTFAGVYVGAIRAFRSPWRCRS